MSMAKAVIIGNLGGDPETKQVGDKTVCNFSVAVNEKFKGQDVVQWFRVGAWGKTGEACQQYLAKGRQVYVEGALTMREYEKDGQKRTSLEIYAHNVQFLGGKSEGEGGESTHRERPASKPAGQTSFAPPGADDDIPF